MSSRERERTQNEAHGRERSPFPLSERDVKVNDGDYSDGVEAGKTGVEGGGGGGGRRGRDEINREPYAKK